MMDDFDWLQKNICPFCGERLWINYINDGNKFCDSDPQCIIVYYKQNNLLESYWSDIILNISDQLSIKYNRGENNFIVYSDMKITTTIPTFDIFNYSLNELEKKIKNYIIYS
jgi:hypothetical protein